MPQSNDDVMRALQDLDQHLVDGLKDIAGVMKAQLRMQQMAAKKPSKKTVDTTDKKGTTRKVGEGVWDLLPKQVKDALDPFKQGLDYAKKFSTTWSSIFGKSSRTSADDATPTPGGNPLPDLLQAHDLTVQADSVVVQSGPTQGQAPVVPASSPTPAQQSPAPPPLTPPAAKQSSPGGIHPLPATVPAAVQATASTPIATPAPSGRSASTPAVQPATGQSDGLLSEGVSLLRDVVSHLGTLVQTLAGGGSQPQQATGNLPRRRTSPTSQPATPSVGQSGQSGQAAADPGGSGQGVFGRLNAGMNQLARGIMRGAMDIFGGKGKGVGQAANAIAQGGQTAAGGGGTSTLAQIASGAGRTGAGAAGNIGQTVTQVASGSAPAGPPPLPGPAGPAVPAGSVPVASGAAQAAGSSAPAAAGAAAPAAAGASGAAAGGAAAGSTGGALAGAGARMGMMAAKVPVVGWVVAAITLLATAAVAAGFGVASLAKNALESAKALAEFSPHIAIVFAQAEMREAVRGIDEGQRTAGSTGALSESYQDLLDNTVGIRSMLTNIWNNGLAFLVRIVARMAEMLQSFVNTIVEWATTVVGWIPGGGALKAAILKFLNGDDDSDPGIGLGWWTDDVAKKVENNLADPFFNPMGPPIARW